MNKGISEPDLKPSIHFQLLQRMFYRGCIRNNYIN